MHYLGEAAVKTAEISEKGELERTEENSESKSEVKILVREKLRMACDSLLQVVNRLLAS